MGEITVVGSLNVDIVAFTKDYPKHGETHFGERMLTLPGGKGANQAVTSARLGKAVQMIGSIGTDFYGDSMVKAMQDNGVDTSYIRRAEEHSTGCAIITVDHTAENTMLVIKGANDCLSAKDIQDAFANIENSKILLVQMEIPEEAIIEAMVQAKKKEMFVILDPAPADGIVKHALPYADLIVPNQQETKELTGIDVTDIDSAIQAGEYFDRLGVKNSIIKMGDKGSLVYKQGKVEYVEAIKVKAIDTVGAGDSYAGAIGFALADGTNLVAAAQFASIVAAIKVSKRGAQAGIPTLDEVNQFCLEKDISYYLLDA
ncbi:ribokinase [Paenibacillus sp. GCM10012306]|uniref:ribokinase n=1 Tax=Paenibacillus sp. GCM10012306 TaxID=3317342 RepID=UPI0036162C08